MLMSKAGPGVVKEILLLLQHIPLHAGLLGAGDRGNQAERGLQALQGMVCRTKDQVARLYIQHCFKTKPSK